jgi:hypothetical protein
MIEAGYTKAWREGSTVETGTAAPGSRFEAIVDQQQLDLLLESSDNGDPLMGLGRWVSEDRLPAFVQPARDATGVKRRWKDDTAQNLYRVQLELKPGSTGIPTRRVETAPVMDEDLQRNLPAGVVQHELIIKDSASRNLQIRSVDKLKVDHD